MTEEEKMRQGLLYDANYDEELLAERRRCKELCLNITGCLRQGKTNGGR